MTNASLYLWACDAYASLGVDVEAAMSTLDHVPVSIHCWQGDDVRGFERPNVSLTGGIQATGNYPGRARGIDQLQEDLSFALSMIPGHNKVNLHAIYLDNGGNFIDRDAIEPKHFTTWADWAISKNIGLDFNSSFFSHEKSEIATLSHADSSIRDFWVEHAIRCRMIGKYLAEKTGELCITNLWIADGAKEIPIDTYAPRMRLLDSLQRVFQTPIDPSLHKDAVESKLFGIGSESYVPGSHEFYMGYAMQHPEILLCLDAGHFHPTEVISSKISAMLCYVSQLLLHVSRPVRWDSDHVVLFDEETRQIMREVVRADALDRVYIATDYFDASINRTAAWCIGSRNTKKALLAALLEPNTLLKQLENQGDHTATLLLTQELLTMPFGIVWDQYCQSRNVPTGQEMLNGIRSYEQRVLSTR